MAPNDSEDLTNQLKFLQNDYTAQTKSTFNRFYCPIMAKDDESAELCMGHIVNQIIPNSPRARVVQRKDVDGFYGKLFEADFSSLVRIRGQQTNPLLLDAELRKKVKPQILLDGQVCDYYEDRGQPVPPQYTPYTIKHSDGGGFNIVIKKTPQEMSQVKQLSILVEYDRRVEAVGSLIKAGYLTLFRMLGYKFALSASGIAVGYSILGDFFRKHHHLSTPDAVNAARDYFRPHINMVRPIANYDGVSRSGTIENSQGFACSNKNGVCFAFLVYVRTDKLMSGVLMPAFDSEAALVAYLDFLNNDEEHFFLRRCTFAEDKKSVTIDPTPFEATWPKKDESFDL